MSLLLQCQLQVVCFAPSFYAVLVGQFQVVCKHHSTAVPIAVVVKCLLIGPPQHCTLSSGSPHNDELTGDLSLKCLLAHLRGHQVQHTALNKSRPTNRTII